MTSQRNRPDDRLRLLRFQRRNIKFCLSVNYDFRIADSLSLNGSLQMRNYLSNAIHAIGFISIAACVGAAQADEAVAEVSDGAIVVHLKGNLKVSTILKKGADPKSRPQDSFAWELSNATVEAGGTTIELDWNDCEAIRDELLWWRMDRHGDLRIVQAEVTGRMTFKRSDGPSGQALVPVVGVESLKVQLVGFDGRPSGPQPRHLVKAH